MVTARGLLTTFADAGVLRLPIPTTSGSIGSVIGAVNYLVCGSGSNPGANPPSCVLEANMGLGTFMLVRDGGVVAVDGTVPMRVQRMPVDLSGPVTDMAGGYTGSASCSGSMPGFVGAVPTPVRFSFRMDESDGGVLTIQAVDPGQTVLSMATSLCSNSPFASSLVPQVSPILGSIVASAADQGLRPAIEASLVAQLCLRAGDGGTCALGTRGDGGICVNSMGRCYSGLHFRPAIPTIPACQQ
ncbi:MAG: hypothetical protein GQE15_12785 [Archangiaceae bacterium]|nr:hypothetical protein [Archangiaceae bacterium]